MRDWLRKARSFIGGGYTGGGVASGGPIPLGECLGCQSCMLAAARGETSSCPVCRCMWGPAEPEAAAPECDHWLGIVQWPGEDYWLRESKREEIAAVALQSKRRWLAEGLGAPSAVDRVRALDTPEKALADIAELFAYCPDCGAKLEGAQGDG